MRSTEYNIGREMSLNEIAIALDIGITRVRQLEKSALEKVRKEIMKHYPEMVEHFRNNKPETDHYCIDYPHVEIL